MLIMLCDRNAQKTSVLFYGHAIVTVESKDGNFDIELLYTFPCHSQTVCYSDLIFCDTIARKNEAITAPLINVLRLFVYCRNIQNIPVGVSARHSNKARPYGLLKSKESKLGLITRALSLNEIREIIS